MRKWVFWVAIAGAAAAWSAASIAAEGLRVASAPTPAVQNPAPASNEPVLSPEQKMARRFPQPVRVGDLVGLPVLDWSDSTIGYVQQVVRTADGKIRLIVPYGRRFGWLRQGDSLFGRRPVAVPIEVVAILARQLAALDMSREEFDAAESWNGSQGQPLSANDIIRIAITRR